MLGLSGQGSAGVSPANSITSAGGIGGLLATHDWGADVSSIDDDESYLHFYDGNGNTGQLVYAKSNTNSGSTAGDLAATYEYDVYGNVTAQTGTYSDENRFRFSTKMFDAESGLGYWGYRYYDPETGRWINRDPIGEDAEINLYRAVDNCPPDTYDPDGRQSQSPRKGVGDVADDLDKVGERVLENAMRENPITNTDASNFKRPGRVVCHTGCRVKPEDGPCCVDCIGECDADAIVSPDLCGPGMVYKIGSSRICV